MPYCPQCGQNHAQTGGAPAARGLSYTEQLRRSANHPLSGLLTPDVHAASLYAHTGAAFGNVPQMQMANAAYPVARTAAPLAFNAAALRAPARATLNPAQRAKLGPFNTSIAFDYVMPAGVPLVAPSGSTVTAIATIKGRSFKPTGYSFEFNPADPGPPNLSLIRGGRDVLFPPPSSADNVPAQMQQANAAAMYQLRVNGLTSPGGAGTWPVVAGDLPSVKPVVLGGGLVFQIQFVNNSNQALSFPRNVTLYGVLG